tara:strand:- start:31 stop:960 length:930 start_codon:yes stop_codon:yes gene_type:complete
MIKKKKILVLGDVMLDRYWTGKVNRISPEAPVPVVDITQTFDKPGGAANVAKNLADFGMDVTLLGLIGDDDTSASLKSLISNSNIAFHPIIDSEIRTTLKLRVIDQNQQLLRIDHEDANISKKIGSSYDKIKELLQNCDGIVISDYNKGVVKPIIQKVIQDANDLGIMTFIDPKGDDFSVYKSSTLVKPNLSEFELIMGNSSNEDEFEKNGKKLREDLNIQYLLVTRGKDGMTLFSEEGVRSFHSIKKDVFDVTGAGDTVISILSSFIIAGENVAKAVELSNIAASLSVLKLGSTSVSQNELEHASKSQ